MPRPRRILLVRGHHPTPWELRPWEELPDDYEVRYLRSASPRYDTGSLRLTAVPVRTRLAPLLRLPLAHHATGVLGERYVGADEAFAWADVVHAEELHYWFSAEAAERKGAGGYRLVQTVWETIPALEAYRTPPARRLRPKVLEHTDLFLATTARARDALLLEGAPADRVRICPPGIDVGRFRQLEPASRPVEHVVLSAGRLVWEKGHQDVIRAVAALRRGVVPVPDGADAPRVLIIGDGPEAGRLREHASELGVGDRVEITSGVPYQDMPAIYAQASCMVLASLPLAGGSLWPGDVPRTFWEEQFGMVIPEAMAAGLPVLASTSGAIPEVGGDELAYFPAGDWRGLAERLAEGPLARQPGERHRYPAHTIEHYSAAAMAARLAEAYDAVLNG